MNINRVYDGGEAVQPSRLGPWPKACEVCALRNTDPQGLGAETQEDLRAQVCSDLLDFYCLHRTDDKAKHRVCACAAAVRKGALQAASPK